MHLRSIVIALVTAVAASVHANPGGAPVQAPARAANPGALYHNYRSVCHGARGDGQGPRAYFINPKPRNFVDPAVRVLLNRPALFAAIAAGKPGTEMPAWNKVIDDQQIADVAEYVFRDIVQPAGASRAKRTP